MSKAAGKKKKEQTLDSEALYLSLLEAIPVYLYALDSEGIILYANRALGKLSTEDLLGKSFFSILPKKHHDIVKKTMADALKGGKNQVYEADVVMPDKTIIHWVTHMVSVGDTEDTVAFLLTGKDITDKVQAEDKSRESESKFRLIFENANDAIVFIDLDGKVRDINDKLEEMFGLKREEVVGNNFFDFGVISEEDMQESVEIFNAIYLGKPAPMVEFRAFHTNKSVLYIEANCKMIVKDETVLGIIIIIRDITERKRVEADLEQYRNHLEELVKERTENLESANTALKVLLKKRDEDKVDLEEKMLANINDLVLPYLDFLTGTKLNSRQRSHMDIIRANLNDIVSPFVRGVSSKHLKLTPTEIKIANLVKNGKTTKEIAEMLGLSIKTIEFHRENLRKKLGIKNQKVNLRTYLLSIQ